MRSSNIELLRIVAMFAIVAHHYVEHSTVMDLFNPVSPTANSIFLQLWGMWGKAAINVFVLITGCFMCEQRLTLRRYMKVLMAIAFWSLITWFVLGRFGYEVLTWKEFFKKVFFIHVIANPNGGFIPGFMWMYLMIPFMNIYVAAATKRNLGGCILFLILMFTGCGTFFGANVYHCVFWYVTLYLVGAYIRLHPFAWMQKNRICVTGLMLSTMVAICSVIAIDGVRMYKPNCPFSSMTLVQDSHKLFALTTALFAFLTFKNWKVSNSRFINAVAQTTFGVFLIHDASDGMRTWLWQVMVNVRQAYAMPLVGLIGYSILVVLCVFLVCAFVDYIIYRKLVERPFLKLFERRD